MTSQQARRAAKILRDAASSLPSFGFSHHNDDFKIECHTLARALDEHAREIEGKPCLGLYLNGFKVEWNGGL